MIRSPGLNSRLDCRWVSCCASAFSAFKMGAAPMSAKCCGAHVFRHTTVFPQWMKEEDNAICKKKGEVTICNYFVFYAGLFSKNCCRLKSELHPTLKIKYWENAFQFLHCN